MKTKKAKVNLLEEKPYQFSQSDVLNAITRLNHGRKVKVETIIKMLFQMRMLMIHHGVFVFKAKYNAEKMLKAIEGQKRICDIIEGRAK